VIDWSSNPTLMKIILIRGRKIHNARCGKVKCQQKKRRKRQRRRENSLLVTPTGSAYRGFFIFDRAIFLR